MYIYIYIYIYIYTHTYIYVYIYTHTHTRDSYRKVNTPRLEKLKNKSLGFRQIHIHHFII